MRKYLEWLFIASFPVIGLLSGLILPMRFVLPLGLVTAFYLWRSARSNDRSTALLAALPVLNLLFLVFMGLGVMVAALLG